MLASLPEPERLEILNSLTTDELRALEHDWRFWARPEQVAPSGDWSTWLVLAGRGFGKTEAGAQWVQERIEAGARSVALVAETQKDLEEVMVPRLLKIAKPGQEPSVRFKPVRMTWPNGAQALGYNGTEPNQLRGPEFDTAWVDELCLVAGTMVEAEFGPKAIETIAVGERVWTRRGLRRVNAAWMTSASAEVWEAKTEGGKRIVGTGNHPVWTREHGFIPLRSLRIGVTICAWKSNAHNGAGKRGISTAITSAIAKASSCIGSFTSRFTAQSGLNSTFTMLTATRQTTQSTTLSQSGGAIICGSMARAASSFGTQSSDGRTLRRMFGQSVSLLTRFASAAASPSRQSGCAPFIAATTASLKPSAPTTPDTTRDVIASVARLPERAAVFNIEVDGEPEYFANGILTHNCKYRYARETWDMLQFTMRAGRDPRVMVTTTPRPIPIIRELLADRSTVVTRGSTMDNAANLPGKFLAQLKDKYEGTRLGRQELNAEVLDDLPGALWTRSMFDDHRVKAAPDMARIVVAVDPSGTAGESDGGDSIGIVVAGKGVDGRAYVLADRSCKLSPDGWARRAVGAYHEFGADRLVAERNFGGAMVEAIIRTVDRGVSYKEVTASRGKAARAEPVAALYEQGRVSHVGALPDVEDQCCLIGPGGYIGEGSPDRLDALVWALTELMLGEQKQAMVLLKSRHK